MAKKKEKHQFLDNNKEKTRKRITVEHTSLRSTINDIMSSEITGKNITEKKITMYEATDEEIKKIGSKILYQAEINQQGEKREYIGIKFDWLGNPKRFYLETDSEYKARKKQEKMMNQLDKYEETKEEINLPKKIQNFLNFIKSKEWQVEHFDYYQFRYIHSSGIEILHDLQENQLWIDLLFTIGEDDDSAEENLLVLPKITIIKGLRDTFNIVKEILKTRKFKSIEFDWRGHSYSIEELEKITKIVASKFRRWLQ